MQDVELVWKKSLDLIRPEISKLSYDTWIKDLVPVKREGNTFYLKTQSSLELGFLLNRFDNLIRNAIKEIDPSIEEVNYQTEDGQLSKKIDEKEETVVNEENTMNPKYTFDRFVIGENNRFARAACIAVAESPSNKYNPLFIYGGVGLGKTHLMQAIGNHVIEEGFNRKVVYVSCEAFTNEFIYAIQNNKSNEFRNKYRSTDLLLIDDIQFLAGKMETQEAFFHTFNTLYESNKQIVITSDRPPKEIPKLEERLRSRFEMGLMADVSAPSFETRVAILLKKAENYDLTFPDEVLKYIAENIRSNIRELEGALTTVVAYCNLRNTQPNLDTAQLALKDKFVNEKQKVDVPFIKKIVAQYFDINVEDIDGKTRMKKVALPRQVAMYLTRELTKISFPKIGEAFGGRDHSTVVHACQKIDSLLAEETEFSNLVEAVREEIQNQTQ